MIFIWPIKESWKQVALSMGLGQHGVRGNPRHPALAHVLSSPRTRPFSLQALNICIPHFQREEKGVLTLGISIWEKLGRQSRVWRGKQPLVRPGLALCGHQISLHCP